VAILSVAAVLAWTVGCSDYRDSGGDDRVEVRESRFDAADLSVRQFQQRDPTLDRFFQNSAGYAVFPEVGKGGAGIGGAHGDGIVYQNGQVIGHAELTQATIGLQLGGQTFSEIIFFQDRNALEQFKQGNTTLSANASAVAASDGAARSADYTEGVAVFVMPRTGLMFEASIGGQKFTYTPISNTGHMNSNWDNNNRGTDVDVDIDRH
jgi:lipid-binding SYLF domain-containing protein